MKSILRAGCLSVSLLSLAPFAQAQEKAKYQHPMYGMGGCGLGSLVIKENTQIMQILALSTNNILVPQTSAITSGTSNCVEGAPSFAKMEQEVYIGANLASLKKEAAQGQGDHLAGLAEVFGCADAAAFAKVSQRQFETLFAGSESNRVVESYHQVLTSTPLQCSRVVSAG